MKERPILFSAPMVRAILAGQKTQTRRVAKEFAGRDDLDAILRRFPQQNGCPYGQPGDRLWVREAWAEVSRHEPRSDEDLPMRLDGRILVYRADSEWDGARPFVCADGCVRWAKPDRWRPSIHMPRWASRITLEITGVRVERLNDITHEDAELEGVTCNMSALGFRDHFRTLWESINGPGSWNANPWVWVVEFQRMES